ncbi:hypothetical protein [Peptostreptococcus equinus]|uniref:Uncharacterized protein n=1 Tax=Peptostreptococcus equinus TaxID=3003601 RepID=A0ABY7JMU2_9FIRM|nr:hypothetical protein [Peptostreptococcus sp. CBA3647]WAW14405.1 hypothetical protein O0R46_07315 [Peptostreptococcus sp. CBA3647]
MVENGNINYHEYAIELENIYRMYISSDGNDLNSRSIAGEIEDDIFYILKKMKEKYPNNNKIAELYHDHYKLNRVKLNNMDEKQIIDYIKDIKNKLNIDNMK